MIIDAGIFDEWSIKGHRYGQCMINPDGDMMYVNIPKNATSWTKPNLLDFKWTESNYHTYNLNVHALVVLRDPVERWLSGIAEYFALYHNSVTGIEYDSNLTNIIFDRITFDDHTEKQVKFVQGLDTDNCTFMLCNAEYRTNFSKFVSEYLGDNKYYKYNYQHVSEDDQDRKHFKGIFKRLLENPKYLSQVQNYFEADYHLINSVKFYEPR